MSLKDKVYHYGKEFHRQAFDHLLWLNFIHRASGDKFKILEGRRGELMLTHHTYDSGWGLQRIKTFRKSYKYMKYAHIAEIVGETDPLQHWEEIRGMLSTQDGELLRFIIKFKVPLEKFIRYELALRGYDENNQWCGFEKAAEIWLK